MPPPGNAIAEGDFGIDTFGTCLSGFQFAPSKYEYQSCPLSPDPWWKTEIRPSGNTTAEGEPDIPTFRTCVSGAQFVPSKYDTQSCPFWWEPWWKTRR